MNGDVNQLNVSKCKISDWTKKRNMISVILPYDNGHRKSYAHGIVLHRN